MLVRRYAMARKTLFLSCIILFSFILTGCDGPIQGTVTDATTDDPIADAYVFLIKKTVDWEPGYVADKILNFDPSNDADVRELISEQLDSFDLDGDTTTNANGKYLFADKEGTAFYGVLVFKQNYKVDFIATTIDFLGLGFARGNIDLTPR